mgnify:CR=1 FL=1
MDLSHRQIIALLALGIAVVLALAVAAFEIWQWKVRKEQLPFWQRLLRGICMITLLLLLTRLIKGTLFVLPGMQEASDILTYWTECLTAAALLTAFVLLDLKAAWSMHRHAQSQISALRQELVDTFKAEAIDEPVSEQRDSAPKRES